MSKALELTGQRFSRLTVLKRVENNKWGQSQWLCQCDCGTQTIVVATQLTSGKTKSCGCYSRDQCTSHLPDTTTHHLSRTPLYCSWEQMKQRCFNSKRRDWMCYGGRGITVCDEWLSSENFFKWALENGYEEGKTLDRIDVDKGYYPENCRWATPKEQGRNKRNNVRVTVGGKEYVLSELAETFNILYETLWHRYKYGDRDERLIRPVRKLRKKSV